MKTQIKVLVVDDSAIVRDILSTKLSQFSDIEIVGTAPDPYIARDKIVRLKPDVLTLDIEMPKMDGLSFLEKLMEYYPLPVIIISSITGRDKYAAIKALEIGAFDVVDKPDSQSDMQSFIEDIANKIRIAFAEKESFIYKSKQNSRILVEKRESTRLLARVSTTGKMIGIGASTGGTVALEFIIKNLPANLPPILIVQHMPPVYTKRFAERLDEISELRVKEAEDEEMIMEGTVYIAKGGMHLGIENKGISFFNRLVDTEKVHFQKPAVDVLFKEMAEKVGKNSIGILLTGMGKDGAEGLFNMKKMGAYTIAQDEASSVVWGMPKAAIEMDAAMEVLPLDKIPERIVSLCT